ncbi:holo-ACP synthase [Buchnera aphidicola]|uniref:holo-ACP synthase n=1 Tax=Buchnera aphidicola TaxID=9 RepID=UPI0034649A81
MCIFGIGIDIVEIKRIQKIVFRLGDKLPLRILSKIEWKNFLIHKNKVFFLAKCFVIKEAASKALGIGIQKKISFKNFQIENDSFGKPKLSLLKEAKKLAIFFKIKRIHVSYTDERMYASAVVIMEK